MPFDPRPAAPYLLDSVLADLTSPTGPLPHGFHREERAVELRQRLLGPRPFGPEQLELLGPCRLLTALPPADGLPPVHEGIFACKPTTCPDLSPSRAGHTDSHAGARRSAQRYRVNPFGRAEL